MTYLQYIKRFYHRNSFWILLTASLQGLISVLVIPVRSKVIDTALQGNAAGNQYFLLFLILFALFTLGEGLLSKLNMRMIEKHNIQTGETLDRSRVEKSMRVKYSLTETPEFHDLLQKAKKAPELDAKCFQAMESVIWLMVNAVGSIVIIWAIDPVVVLGILVLLAAGLYIENVRAKKTEGFWGKYMEKMHRCNYLSELLMQREYAAERKLFGYQEKINSEFNREFEKARTENIKMGRMRVKADMTWQIVCAVYVVALIFLLVRPLIAGKITLGVFYSVYYSASLLINRCAGIWSEVFNLTESFHQLKKYFAFLNLEEDSTEWSTKSMRVSEGLNTKKVSGDRTAQNPVLSERAELLLSLEFRNVSFNYPGASQPVLKNLSFRLEPGKHYALVGENGCGKSTLVKLLAGLYEPSEGEILINGRSAAKWDGEKMRKLFSVVFQDFYRYPLTVRENVCLSAEEQLDEEKIGRVFEAMQLDTVIEKLPQRADTSLLPLYENGVSLSGGEWQKLTIARCVLSGSQVAVLDEPNASLDPISEASIYQAYRELLKSSTTLFISHRLGSVQMSDEILVLKDGKLLAMDSHENLLKNCGYYAKLFDTQRGLYLESQAG